MTAKNGKPKKWIAGAIKRPGALTSKAKKAGLSVSKFIAKKGPKATGTLAKQINLAKTLKGISKKKK